MAEETRNILTVSQLTSRVRQALEAGIPRLWVQGEVSNFTAHASGHLYFTLKDAGSQLRCVMFRGAAQALRIFPQDGMQVLAQGDVTVFERAGQYQLNVIQLQPAGQGELALALVRLKRKLEAEGLFEQARKRPLPKFPKAIGLVTSPTGATIRDIIKVARRRWPGIELILNPVPVQGPGAAEEIARAIGEFNEYGRVDVLIVGRGGGSIEDLWAFNEEAVVRAIAGSKIPVISAVGHEVDFTLADLAADLRAPTPSAAAELAVPSRNEIQETVAECRERLSLAVQGLIDGYRLRLDAFRRSHGMKLPGSMVEQRRQLLDSLWARAGRGLCLSLEKAAFRADRLRALLAALDPKAVLGRGYSICFDRKGRAVKEAGRLSSGEKVRTRFWKGEASMKVEEIHGQG
jgi:exodeoxyribonuclease VII large subunit